MHSRAPDLLLPVPSRLIVRFAARRRSKPGLGNKWLIRTSAPRLVTFVTLDHVSTHRNA
jgi:ABC-type arginine transport system permease subunit